MKATKKSIHCAFLVMMGVLISNCGLADESAPVTKSLKLLNGEERLIVVNGYSTSFHWPKLLQRKLDRHFDGKRVVDVQSATQGGTPIAKWVDVKTGKPLKAWEKVTRTLRAKGKRPAIVLGQQSLQWVFGKRTSGISSKNDTEAINKGADAIAKYVKLLHESGADFVFVAMHIYKRPMEPQIANERLALAKFAKTRPAKFASGPDVWTPTKALYPWGFAEDKVHPGNAANAVMAHLWFEVLCRHDGIEVPQWSKEEMDQAIEKAKTGQGSTMDRDRGDRRKRPGFRRGVAQPDKSSVRGKPRR